MNQVPDINGRFGKFGGRYVPETLMNALIELEEAYTHYSKDPDFIAEVRYLLNQYSGRPTSLYYAERLTEHLGGAKIYLKTRRSEPYRCAQNKQYNRPGRASQTDG